MSLNIGFLYFVLSILVDGFYYIRYYLGNFISLLENIYLEWLKHLHPAELARIHQIIPDTS